MSQDCIARELHIEEKTAYAALTGVTRLTKTYGQGHLETCKDYTIGLARSQDVSLLFLFCIPRLIRAPPPRSS